MECICQYCVLIITKYYIVATKGGTLGEEGWGQGSKHAIIFLNISEVFVWEIEIFENTNNIQNRTHTMQYSKHCHGICFYQHIYIYLKRIS